MDDPAVKMRRICTAIAGLTMESRKRVLLSNISVIYMEIEGLLACLVFRRRFDSHRGKAVFSTFASEPTRKTPTLTLALLHIRFSFAAQTIQTLSTSAVLLFLPLDLRTRHVYEHEQNPDVARPSA